MNYIVIALLANFSYAVSDIFNGLLSKRNSAIKVGIWVSIFAALIYLIPALFFFDHEIEKINFSNLLLMLGTGTILELGYLSFLLGMRRGSIVLTGVIGGSFPAVTVLLSLLFFDEKITIWQALAITMVLIGIFLSSAHESLKKTFSHIKTSALIYAFGAFLLWGIYFAIIHIPIEKVGWFMPQYTSNIVGIVLCLALALLLREKSALSLPKNKGWFLAVAILGLGGTMLFSYGVSKGPTSIVAPIAGSSPAVFATLAFIVFKERLTRLQEVGIVVALAGIISLSILTA